MYKYNENNFNKFIISEINKYIKILLIFIILDSFLIYQLGQYKIGLFEIIFGTILATLILLSLIMLPTLGISYKKNAKLICKNYNFEIENNKIVYYTEEISSYDGIFDANRKQYIINNVKFYVDKNAYIIIYGDINVIRSNPYAKKVKIKEYKRKKCYVLKGISNIEEFKQELEEIKNV